MSTSQLESPLHVILLPPSPSHSPPSGSSELLYSVPDVGCFLSNFIKIILTLPSEPFLNCFISETKNPQEGTLISSVPPEDHEGTPPLQITACANPGASYKEKYTVFVSERLTQFASMVITNCIHFSVNDITSFF